MFIQSGGLFTSLLSQEASFQWQLPGRFHVDASGMMRFGSAFEIGCDGRFWWWHMASSSGTNLVVCPVNEMQMVDTSFCDPFAIANTHLSSALTPTNLIYRGYGRIGNDSCHVFERWQVDMIPGLTPVGALTEWYIDGQTSRIVEVRQAGANYRVRTRFIYESFNQALAPEQFAVPKIPRVSPAPPDALDSDYTNRLVIIRDGSDGQMRVRWGKQGPKGTASDGLN
jgi:hypothetical protein